jgi:hypothetical protein
MRSGWWRLRVRSMMLAIVVLAIILGAWAERARTKSRWAQYRQIAAEHSKREEFYLRLARRFEELARVEAESATAEDPRGKDAAEHALRADSLRRAAEEYSKGAAEEAKSARELLRRW